jgi:hypothetical protein
VSSPPSEPATLLASWRRAGGKSLPPSTSLVAAAVVPLRSSHVKSAAACAKSVRPPSLTHVAQMGGGWTIKSPAELREHESGS